MKFNPLLIYLFRDNLLNVHRARHPGKPLGGLRLLDVGCGGGLLTEVNVSFVRKMQNKHMQTFPPIYILCPFPILSISTFHVTSVAG